MHSLNIQLTESTYKAIIDAAKHRGLSVEALAADRLEQDFGGDDLPRDFWSPELLASLDASVAESNEGQASTVGEMREEIAERSRAWRENHPA